MAEWKKIIVSGSNISQLNNDAGYLTSATAFNSFVTASINGVPLIADSTTDTLNFVTGSAGAGLTIVGTAGTDTITFDLSAIPNTSLENDGITIAGVDTSLGGTITAATIGNAGGFFSSSAQVDHDQTTNFSADEHFTQANITTVGTVTAGDVSAILPAGTVSGSAQISYAGITGIPSGIVSGSSLSSATQGTAVLTTNGVAGSTVDLGLETTDSPTFASLTLTGDLTVQGTTTTLNTANLLVEDRFALFNSGSATGDGGIVVQTETNGSGTALGWDDSEGRFGLQIGTKLAHDATAIAPDSYLASVVTSDDATYQKNGNIRVESGDIYIYVE